MEHKENILIVHNYYQIPGGEDTVVANEKKMLEEHGHKVIVYSRNNSELAQFSIFKKLLLPAISIFNIKTFFDIKRIVKKEKIEIVHVHNTLCLISAAVYYAAGSCKIPVVQTVHNFRFLCPKGVCYRDGMACEECIHRGLIRALKYKCYRNSRIETAVIVCGMIFHRLTGIYRQIYYVCLTDFNKILLSNHPQIEENRIFIKPNFSDVGISIDENQNRSYYLFVGRLEDIKGIDLILKGFIQMKDRVLHIVGVGKEKYENEYLEYNNIVFLGSLDKTQLQKEYSGAKALVMANKTYEGFPMVIVEAYANGCPVIAPDFGNAGLLVDECLSGFHYKQGDANSLIETINTFEKDDIQRLSEYCINKYKTCYSDEQNYRELKNIYEALINK